MMCPLPIISNNTSWNDAIQNNRDSVYSMEWKPMKLTSRGSGWMHFLKFVCGLCSKMRVTHPIVLECAIIKDFV
jgi:hypothetical protein